LRPHYVRPLAARDCAKVGSRSARHHYAHAVAETSYASCGDLSLAYQVFGDGPVELVFIRPFVSHVELSWAMPEFKAFFDQLSRFSRVLLFDKAGLGLSDPVPNVRTLDDRAGEIEAVMDAAGFGEAVVFGLSEGGPQAVVFAAKRPERTRALILTGTYPFASQGWDDIDRDPAELRARSVAELGEEYAPSTEQLARMQEFGRAGPFGLGQRCRPQDRPAHSPVDTPARNVRAHERKPGDGAGNARSGVPGRRPADPAEITAPTMVVYAREDPGVPVQCRRYIADQIAGARWLEVEGVDSLPWLTEPGRILTGIEEFLTGTRAAPTQSHRALRTVLFTDMVASTRRAAVMVTSGGVRCSTALVRSQQNSRNDSAARW
jgi:pimeloyl-ACP methyl ester carboxylesterase